MKCIATPINLHAHTQLQHHQFLPINNDGDVDNGPFSFANEIQQELFGRCYVNALMEILMTR